MHVSPNKEIAPEWIMNREIITSDLTAEGRALLDAIKSSRTGIIRIRFHLTERELIHQGRLPVEHELNRFVHFIGADALDTRRVQTWHWGGLRWSSRNERRESPEEYLNRNAVEIAAVGEIVR